MTNSLVIPRARWPKPSTPAALSSATSIIAALGGFPAAAVLAQKMKVLSIISQCVSNTDPESSQQLGLPPLSFDGNPTTLVIGAGEEDVNDPLTENASQYRGSLVGNTAIVLGFLLLQRAVAQLLASSGRAVSIESAVADVHFPGLAAIIVVTFCVPTAVAFGAVAASPVIFARSASKVSLIFELATGALAYLVLPLVGLWWVARGLEDTQRLEKLKTPKRRHYPGAGHSAPCVKRTIGDIRFGFDYFLEGSRNWAESPFVKRFADAMDCCAVPKFVVFDYFVSIAVGLVSGLALVAATRVQCFIYAGIILFLCLLHTAAVVLMRPMTARFDRYFAVFASLVTSVSSLLALLQIVGIEIDLEAAVVYISTICMVGSATSFLGKVSPILKRLRKLWKLQRLRNVKSKKNKKRANKKFSRSNLDDLDEIEDSSVELTSRFQEKKSSHDEKKKTKKKERQSELEEELVPSKQKSKDKDKKKKMLKTKHQISDSDL